MPNQNTSTETELAFDYIDRNRDALAGLSDALFYFGELGMQEHRSTALVAETLGAAGFECEVGFGGFPSAVKASYGSGSPVIAIHTEYDGNPDNSQVSGVAERREIVPGAPGHCEGHNVNGAVMVAAALVVRKVMAEKGLGGTLKVIGAPAEEQLLSRPYMVRDGHFDDVGIAFHDHVSGFSETNHGVLLSALVSANFTFHGETAHAGMAPWKARDALDAVVLMDAGMAQYREHFEPGMSAQRVITNGGVQPNVIPPEATIWWYFRHPNAEGAEKLFIQARRIAEGAALMTNCELELDLMSAVWPLRANHKLAQIIQQNIELVGLPEWTEEEETLARDVQKAAGVDVDGLARAIRPLGGPAKQIPAGNDAGDVSWKVPMGRVWFPSNIPNVPFHHWAGGVALATSIAHKGAVTGAKVLAGSVLDFFLNPEMVDEAKEGFASEIGDQTYKPLLAPDQTPPLELNLELMEKFREPMSEHYVNEVPRFSD